LTFLVVSLMLKTYPFLGGSLQID